MSKKLLLLVLCITFAVPSALVAQNKSSGSRKHSTSSETSTGKTVHVRSYKKKNGTVVKSYKRRPPNSKGATTEDAPKDEAPRN